MSESLVITGMGVISAIGFNVAEHLEALRHGRSGIAPVRFLPTTLTQYPVGEVKMSTAQMAECLGLDPQEAVTRSALLGLWAAREALTMAGLCDEELADMPFVSGTTVGGMDTTEQYFDDFLTNDSRNDYAAQHDCGACTAFIAAHLGRFSRLVTPSTACASAANAIMAGADMLRSGQATRVLVGGSECLTRFHLNGFASLMILDEAACRPFCDTRSGLNLGEGAGYLVLETATSALQRGAKPLAVLAGYGNACDAFHPTASSPQGDGAYLAMQQALDDAGVLPSKVDYVNAHGTATPNNDESETRAMQRLFGSDVPPVSSTKAFTGHTTSASGSIEAVFCVLALQHQFLPLNLNFTRPIADGIVPVCDSRPSRPLRRVLCNAFGFGGNDCSMLLASADTLQPYASTMQPYDNTMQSSADMCCGETAASATCDAKTPSVFITAAQQISIQEGLSEQWLSSPLSYEPGLHRSLDVDYKVWIARNEARRMGKLTKRALTTSLAAMQRSGVERPDGVFCGTGLGQVENTEAILRGMLDEGEPCQKPTNFMQSTHNTISSQVSISTHNTAPNITYAQQLQSFDCALADAFTQMRLRRIMSALVGGYDEMTEAFYTMQCRAGNLGADGQVTGETAVSLMLQTGEAASADVALCRLAAVEMLWRPTAEELQDKVRAIGPCSAVVCSAGAAREADVRTLFGDTLVLNSMPVFGESFTAFGLAVYAAAHIVRSQQYPEAMHVSGVRPEALQRIVVVNNQHDEAFTFVVLEQCKRENH